LHTRAAHPTYLHPFPTRRSSDLEQYLCQHNAEQAAGYAQDDALGEELAHEVGRSGADRPADRHFTHAAGGRSAPERPTSCANSSDRKSTRLNSSHVATSYAVFCL